MAVESSSSSSFSVPSALSVISERSGISDASDEAYISPSGRVYERRREAESVLSERSVNSDESEKTCISATGDVFERRREAEAQRSWARVRMQRMERVGYVPYDASQGGVRRATQRVDDTSCKGRATRTRPNRNTPHEQAFSKSISMSSVVTARMDNTEQGRIEREILSEAEAGVVKQDRKAGTHKADNTAQRRIAGDILAETELDAGTESRGHEEPGRVQQDGNVRPQEVLPETHSSQCGLERKQELNKIQKGLQIIETAQMKLQRREQELRMEEFQMSHDRQFQVQQLKSSRQWESMTLSDLKRESSFKESNHASFPMSTIRTNRRKMSEKSSRRRPSGEGRRRQSSADNEARTTAKLQQKRETQSRSARSGNGVEDSSLHASWPEIERQRRPPPTDEARTTAPGTSQSSFGRSGNGGGDSSQFLAEISDLLAAEAAAALHKAGRSEMSIGDYKAAISSLDRALYLYKIQHGTNHLSVANVHHDLGLARLELGDYEAAGADLLAAQQIRINCSDPVRAADSLKELGMVHNRAGNPARALECYTECFKVLRAELGEDNSKTAIACKDMGEAESALSKNTEACEHYEMALAIMKLNAVHQPPDAEIHSDVMNLLHKLGKLKFKVGKLNDALDNLEEFYQLRRDREEEFSNDDADALYTISKIYTANGDIVRAQKITKEALHISRQHHKASPISSKGNERSEQKEQKKSITASGDGCAGGSVPSTSHESATSIDPLQHHVPFVQIYEEQHKRAIRPSLRSVTLRIFYGSQEARDEVSEVLKDVGDVMTILAEDAKKILSDPNCTPAITEQLVLDHLIFDGADVSVRKIDSSAPKFYGLAIDVLLFWEAYVMAQDCNPDPCSDLGTEQRRISNPDMQEKNFEAMRLATERILEEVPVVMQMDNESPMNPKTLAVAYEREGQVHLASSEFYDRYH